MTRHTFFFVTLLLAAGVVFAQKPYDEAAEKQYEQGVVAAREKGLFKQIDWKKDAAEARKAAEEQKRPIFVFIVVGEMAKKNAPDC